MSTEKKLTGNEPALSWLDSQINDFKTELQLTAAKYGKESDPNILYGVELGMKEMYKIISEHPDKISEWSKENYVATALNNSPVKE